MDDNLYDYMVDYVRYSIIEKLQKEYDETGKLKDCPTYSIAQDFVKALNIVGKYSGYDPKKVSDLIIIPEED
jgi:hypothetical protein